MKLITAAMTSQEQNETHIGLVLNVRLENMLVFLKERYRKEPATDPFVD